MTIWKLVCRITLYIYFRMVSQMEFYNLLFLHGYEDDHLKALAFPQSAAH